MLIQTVDVSMHYLSVCVYAHTYTHIYKKNFNLKILLSREKPASQPCGSSKL